MNDLIDYLMNLVEKDKGRYSFEWSCLNVMELYDKENKIGYKVQVSTFEHKEDENR